MKINPINASDAISKFKVNSVKKNSTVDKQELSDKVEFSDDARLYLDALNKAKSADDVRLDKVNDIKGRINSGNYSVSSEDVAKSILKASNIDIEI